MAIPLGIRGRVLCAVLLTIVVAQLGSVVVLRQILVVALDRRVDQSLAQEVTEFRRLAGGNDPRTGRSFGTDTEAIVDAYLSRNVPDEREAVVAVIDGELYPAGRRNTVVADPALLQRWAAPTSRQRDRVSVQGQQVDYLTAPFSNPDGGAEAVFIVLYDYDGERAEIDAALRQSELVALLILVPVAGLGWVVSNRATAPLRRLTATAHTIGTGQDLSRRLPATPGRDETATLTSTFNAMLDRLETVFAQQRDFVADAGHELRTPITVVRGQLELLSPDPVEQRETIQLVTGELDRMTRMVEDMLTLARLGRPDFLRVQALHVGPLLDQVCTKAHSLGARRWSVAGAPTVPVDADPQRLTQALMQLASNAVRHTQPDTPIVLGAALAGAAAPVGQRPRHGHRRSGPGAHLRAVHPHQLEQTARTRLGSRPGHRLGHHDRPHR